MKQTNNINRVAEFFTGGRVKKDLFKGRHFNIVAIYLDSGAEILPHDEPYEVYFYVVSGKGVFTVGEEQMQAEAGSTVFSPRGIRGIRCIERFTILGIQEPH